MGNDPKAMVAASYDSVAERYLAGCGSSGTRRRWLAVLLRLLPSGARVLDLGCGAGIPVAAALTAAGHEVVGLDGSARQIELACANVPQAEFVHADMTAANFASASFDAVAAFYSITHVPRAEHEALFHSIASWLRPGGVFLASLGASDTPGWTGLWLGAPMHFSHFDADANIALVRAAGLRVETAELLAQDDEDAEFLWVVARRPG